MNLLAAVLYDPASKATKSLTTLSALAAVDTTNLRLAVTVPAHGMVRFRLSCCFSGPQTPGTMPAFLLGVLTGATVVGRLAANVTAASNTANGQLFLATVEFTATGLTAGATNFDAAWAVQLVGGTGSLIQYGGPNTNAGTNAGGGFSFEAFDPQPQTANTTLAVSVAGAVTVGTNNDKTGYALAASQHVIVDSGVVTTLTNLPAIPANWLTAAGIASAALNGKGDWNIGKTGYTLTQAFPTNFSAMGVTAGGKLSGVVLVDTLTTYTNDTPQTGDSFARIGAAGAGLTALGDTRIANLDTTVSSRGTSTLTQTQVTGGTYSVQSASCVLGDARIAHLNADVDSRMATYTQPTGFLAATFPTSVASPTNITAGTITTTSNLTNAPTAGDFTAAMKASLNAATPASVVGAVGSVTSSVTVGTNNDKTGYALTQTFPTNFAALGIGATGHVTNVDTIAAYAGNTPQTGDVATVIAKLPANTIADESLVIAATNSILMDTATIKAKTNNLPAAPAAVSDIPTAAQTAAAWGGSVVGNGRTRDYFLQGGVNRITFAADGLSYTLYQTDDTTPLCDGTATRLATNVGGLESITPV